MKGSSIAELVQATASAGAMTQKRNVEKTKAGASNAEAQAKKPKVEKPDSTYVDTRIAQKTAGRAKRSMVSPYSCFYP